MSSITCFCSGHCPGSSGNGTCVTRAGGYCYAFVQEVVVPETNRLEAEFSYGCLQPDVSGYMQCQGDLSPHAIPRSIKCCRDQDHCNVHLKPQYKSSISDPDPPLTALLSEPTLIWLVPLAVTAVLLLIILIVVWLKVRAARRAKTSCDQSFAGDSIDSDDGYDGRYSAPDSGFETTNSSGAKVPLLINRHVSCDLGSDRPLARGRYGQVSVVWLRGAQVAMKVFSTTEEISWKREVAIYNTPLLRHDNILGFIAADIHGSQGVTKMLLLTDFHEKGSLFDFLSLNVLDDRTALRLIMTIACGLAHLHSEISGKQSKPAIAHRDIKSKNILVKSNLTCCIADFGLSVTYESATKCMDTGEIQTENIRVGTKRYMAPEVLDGSLCVTDFESYKRTDVYAFALVIWEILRRVSDGGRSEDYQIPYQGLVPNDPSFEEMKKLVCDQKIRPSVKQMTSKIWAPITKLMTEGWSGKPKVRPTALKLKKELSRLAPQPALDTNDAITKDRQEKSEKDDRRIEKTIITSSSSSSGQSGYKFPIISSKHSAKSPSAQPLGKPDLLLVV